MDLPVYENDAPVGTLCVSRQGLYTVFAAELAPAAPDAGLSRLWLLDGSGAAAPLGLLEPAAGGRRLRRRLSRLERQKLPPEPWTALVLPASAEAPAPAAKREGPPSASGSGWLRLSDASLYDPARGLLALPWAGGEPPAPARKMRLDGREYLLFRT